MATDEQDVRAAFDQWFVALNAMVAGDPKPFADIWSHAADTIYMSGEGTYVVGYDAAYADWQRQAAASLGGETRAEKVAIVIVGDLATVGNIARASVKGTDGKTDEIVFRHTTAFRKEAGGWKIVSHHADNSPDWAEVVNR
jgi:ketosteroid isomerase-like protein